MGAVRARLSFQSERVRGSFAAGFGLSIKDMLFERDTKSNNGGENIYTDKSGHSYVSPGISLDGSVSLRFSPTLALALGLMGWFENAGQNVQSAPSSNAPFQAASFHAIRW